MDEVIVVGSGPAGLSTAAELGRRGTDVTVLERGDRVGAAWAGRYEGLRFNTSRWISALPGAPFPRDFGWFPTRDQYVGYLDGYAARHHVRARTGVEVERIDPRGPDGPGWRVTAAGGGTFEAPHVVVATGALNRPRVPTWADGGAAAYRGSVVHSSDYHDARPYRDRRVLVVGSGSTGMEIARQLVDGGAAQVLLAVRTPPNLLPRESRGLPFDLPVPLLLHLPVPVVDAMLARVQRVVWGDLSAWGLPPSPDGAISGLRLRGGGTAVVDKETIDAVRAGAITVVAAVRALDEGGALLADGSVADVDDVVLATGYGAGLEPVVGHLGVLDERGMPQVTDGGEVRPGLRFVGYVYRPGLTGYVGRLARRAAKEIAGSRERVLSAPPAPA